MATKKASKQPRAKTGETTARVESMRLKAFELKLQNQTCTQIGEALGVSRVRAWQLLNEHLEELKAETLDKAEQWRAILSGKALEQAHKGELLQEKATEALGKPDGTVDLAMLETANSMINAAHEKLAKLWGAYSPTRVESKSELKADVTSAGVPLGTAGAEAALQAMSAEQLAALEAVLTPAQPAEAPLPG